MKTESEYEVHYDNLKPIVAMEYGRNKNLCCGREFADSKEESISNSSDYVVNGEFVKQTKMSCKKPKQMWKAKAMGQWWKTLNLNYPWNTSP